MVEELYKSYNIMETPFGWYATVNLPDGYDEHGPFATREAAMEWVDQHTES